MKKRKQIRVKFAGILVDESYKGELTILYTPDQRQVLMPGQVYKIIIEGLSFAQEDTGEPEANP